MAKRVNIHEAKTHLSRLIARAENGETIVICRAGKPVVKLKSAHKRPRAKFGFARGTVHYTDDAFAPMSEDELKEWYDAPIISNEGDSRHARPPVVRPRRSKNAGSRSKAH